jgi:uncharacterized phage protein (TIGR02218 family)
MARKLPAGISAQLASGASTLAHCWRLERKDGLVLGFTDHDRELAFGGLTFEPSSGFSGSEAASTLGLSADTQELSGAVRSEAITEKDLAAGFYDDAEITLFLVNWRDTDDRTILQRGHLGRITRTENAFRAEFRSLAHRLHQPQGRALSHTCDAELGDHRCGASVSSSLGAVSATDGAATLEADGLGGAPQAFAGGLLTFTSGANAGQSVEVKTHTLDGSRAFIALWAPMRAEIGEGDSFEIRPGCDKTFETCVKRFGNGANFRGFPHIPGGDFIFTYARTGQTYDGGGNFGAP